jgi:hypothetical protein
MKKTQKTNSNKTQKKERKREEHGNPFNPHCIQNPHYSLTTPRGPVFSGWFTD